MLFSCSLENFMILEYVELFGFFFFSFGFFLAFCLLFYKYLFGKIHIESWIVEDAHWKIVLLIKIWSLGKKFVIYLKKKYLNRSFSKSHRILKEITTFDWKKKSRISSKLLILSKIPNLWKTFVTFSKKMLVCFFKKIPSFTFCCAA